MIQKNRDRNVNNRTPLFYGCIPYVDTLPTMVPIVPLTNDAKILFIRIFTGTNRPFLLKIENPHFYSLFKPLTYYLLEDRYENKYSYRRFKNRNSG